MVAHLASAFMSPFSQCAQQPLLVTHLTPRIASANRQTEGQKGRVKKLSDRRGPGTDYHNKLGGTTLTSP